MYSVCDFCKMCLCAICDSPVMYLCMAVVCVCVTDQAQVSVPVCRVRAPSLAETEEALAHAVWSWAGVSRWCLLFGLF